MDLFAEVIQTMDPTAAWAAVIIQGGAFMLVVYIVVRLYPQMSKESGEERERREMRLVGLVDSLQVKFEERNNKIVGLMLDMQTKFEGRNKEVVDAVERQTFLINESFEKSAERIESAVTRSCQYQSRGRRHRNNLSDPDLPGGKT